MTCSPVSLYDSPEFHTAYLIVTVNSPSVPRWKLNSTSEAVNFNQIHPIPKTYVFSIDKCTGGIYHAGIPFIDIFTSQETASNYLRNLFTPGKKILDPSKPEINSGTFQSLGEHLIGATIYDDPETMKEYLVILVVNQNEVAAELFNQPIYKITDVSYTFIELHNQSMLSTSPTSNLTFTYCQSYEQFMKSGFPIRITSLFRFDLRQTHFYSPTLDMNSQFPYPLNVISNGSFCWNKRFLIPFEDNNCLQACVIILQGGVYVLDQESKASSPSEMKDNIIYIAKRSSMYPGTRYNVRGLKVTSSNTVEPANECECELIFTHKDSPYYYSQSWRRGSPPVFWQTKVDYRKFGAKNVLKSQPSLMTSTYFNQHIIKRFRCHNLHVVSLLHPENKGEKDMNDAYEIGLDRLRTKWADVPVTVTFQRFDLNKQLAVNEGNLDAVAYNFYNDKTKLADGSEITIADDVEHSHFTVANSTTGKLEDNDASLNLEDTCSMDMIEPTPDNSGYADLDNQTSTDTSTEVSATSSEQFNNDAKQNHKRKLSFVDPSNVHRQGTVFRFNCADSLDRTNVGTFFYALLVVSKYAYEENVVSFIENPEMSWKNPVQFLKMSIIDYLGQIFLESGNIISLLYTGTNAIKKGVIEHFTSGGTSTEMWNTIKDGFISTIRRFKNLLVDPIRQKQIDNWTEIHQIKDPKFVIDPQHTSFCSMFNENLNEVNHSLFQPNQKIFNLSAQSKEIMVMFPEPFILCGISFMTLSRNIDENLTISISFPSKSRNRRIFFTGMPFPIINPNSSADSESFVWINYDLRKIARYSNIFPNDSDCMKPTVFASITFTSNADLKIGNIKFIVKRPKSMLAKLLKMHRSIANQRYSKSNQYELVGTPPTIPGKDLVSVCSQIYNEFASEIQVGQLPNMDQLMSLMLQWIRAGISDYYKFPIFVQRNINPWVFDLSSRMHNQLNKSICPFCNRNKTKWKEMFETLKQMKEKNVDNNEILRQSTVYMENPEFPLFFIKTINPDINPEIATFLCHECSAHYDELMKNANPKKVRKQSEDICNSNSNNEEEEIYDSNDLGDTGENDDDVTIQSNIINQYHDNFVNLGDVTDYSELTLPALFNGEISHLNGAAANLNEIARIYNQSSSISYSDLTNALHASSNSNSNFVSALIQGKQISFCVAFAAFVIPNSVTLLLNENPLRPFKLSCYIPGYKENVIKTDPEISSSFKQYRYSLTFPPNSSTTLQSLIFKFSTEDQSDIKLSINMLNINGIISMVPPKYQPCNIRALEEKPVSLPKFSLMKDVTWDQQFRTQRFSFVKSSSLFSFFTSAPLSVVSGIAVQMNSKAIYKDYPKCIILAFYKNNQLVNNSIHTIILPTEISSIYSISKKNVITNNGNFVDCLYFPISPSETDFDSISVFYTDRSATADPLKIMFF